MGHMPCTHVGASLYIILSLERGQVSGSTWSLANVSFCYVLCPLNWPRQKTIYMASCQASSSLWVTTNLTLTVDYKLSALCSFPVPNSVLFFPTAPLSIFRPCVGSRHSRVCLPCLVGMRGALRSCSQTLIPETPPCPC